MVRGILFDLDGTLFDRDSAIRALVSDQHRRLAEDLTGISVAAYVSRIIELDAHGHGDKTAVYQRVVADFGLPASLAATLTADFWREYHTFCRPFPEILPTLTRLRARHLKLGIITNGAVHIQEPAILRLGLERYMDIILISEREGVRKPDREIFERALRLLDLPASETWYVGDHPDVDVRGAVNAGLTAVWRRTPCWPEPVVTHKPIDGLDDLLALVLSNVADAG